MLHTFRDGQTRRDFLRIGALGGLGLSQILRMQQAARADGAPKKDINCIFIFLIGGMPQHDMWDPKPSAPAEIRGDFKPAATSVPGVRFTEVMPGLCKVADQVAVLRGMTHGDSDHGRGYHIMMTGMTPGAGDFNATKNNNVHPSLGSLVARLGKNGGSLPPYVSVPGLLRSGGQGRSFARYLLREGVQPDDLASGEGGVRHRPRAGSDAAILRHDEPGSVLPVGPPTGRGELPVRQH